MDGDGKPSTRPLWTAIAPAQCPNDLITTGRSWFLTWSWVKKQCCFISGSMQKQSEWVNKSCVPLCQVRQHAGKQKCNQAKADLKRISKQRKHLRHLPLWKTNKKKQIPTDSVPSKKWCKSVPQEVVCLSFPLKIQHKSEAHPRKFNIYVKHLQLNKPINIPINEFVWTLRRKPENPLVY